MRAATKEFEFDRLPGLGIVADQRVELFISVSEGTKLPQE